MRESVRHQEAVRLTQLARLPQPGVFRCQRAFRSQCPFPKGRGYRTIPQRTCAPAWLNGRATDL